MCLWRFGQQQCTSMIFILTSVDLCHGLPFVLLRSLLIPQRTRLAILSPPTPFLCWHPCPHSIYSRKRWFNEELAHHQWPLSVAVSLPLFPLSPPFVRLQFTCWSPGWILLCVLPALLLITGACLHLLPSTSVSQNFLRSANMQRGIAKKTKHCVIMYFFLQSGRLTAWQGL